MKVEVYTATWCGQCRSLKPQLRNAGIEFTSVDVDANLEKAGKAHVRGLPTTVILDDEGKELHRIIGGGPGTLKRIQELLEK